MARRRLASSHRNADDDVGGRSASAVPDTVELASGCPSISRLACVLVFTVLRPASLRCWMWSSSVTHARPCW
eukprot:scaffold217_cov377-Prasinococcus_capsulatus_cf.AAC.12